MRLTYHEADDSAYVELADDWKGRQTGWSNMALLRADDEEEGAIVECHFFFDATDNLQAIKLRHASRWLSADPLGRAEPFERWDGVDRD